MCTVDSAGAGTTGAAGPGAVTSVAMAMANIVDNKSENMFVFTRKMNGLVDGQKIKIPLLDNQLWSSKTKTSSIGDAGNLHCFKIYSPKKLFFPSSLYP